MKTQSKTVSIAKRVQTDEEKSSTIANKENRSMKTRTRALNTKVTIEVAISKDEAAKTQHREEESIPVAGEEYVAVAT